MRVLQYTCNCVSIMGPCMYASALLNVFVYMFSKQKPLYFCTIVMACLTVCLFLLHLGVLCILRMCGVYVRHHLPSLHPRPMAVFRCQHLRMGPVCLAHRLVQVFCRLFISASQQPSSPQRLGARRNSQLPSFLKSADFYFSPSSLTFMQREESVYPLYRCGSCLCTLKPPYGSKI